MACSSRCVEDAGKCGGKVCLKSIAGIYIAQLPVKDFKWREASVNISIFHKLIATKTR